MEQVATSTSDTETDATTPIAVSFRGHQLPIINLDVGKKTVGDLKAIVGVSASAVLRGGNDGSGCNDDNDQGRPQLPYLPPDTQKLFFKSKLLAPNDALLATILSSQTPGSPQKPVRILLVATDVATVKLIHDADVRHANATAAYAHALKTRPQPPPTNRPGNTITSLSTPSYTFDRLDSLKEFDDHDAAHRLLHTISTDTAIVSIMTAYRWRVGVLREIHPHRESTVLGFNRNRGQEIAIRLRTDRLDGFRAYQNIIDVLVHELTHMVHGDHDHNFYALNRQLTQHVASMHRGVTLDGSYRRHGSPQVSNNATTLSTIEGRVDGGVYVLDGNRDDVVAGDKPSREVLARAAMLRLMESEKAITNACGTSSSSSSQHNQANQSEDSPT